MLSKILNRKRLAKNNNNHIDSDDSVSSDCEDYETLSDESSFVEKKPKSNKKNKKEISEDDDEDDDLEKDDDTEIKEKDKKKDKKSFKKNKKQNNLILLIGPSDKKDKKEKSDKTEKKNDKNEKSEKKKSKKSEDEDDEDEDDDSFIVDDEDEEDDDDDTDDSYEYYLDDIEKYDSETERVFMKDAFDNDLETIQNAFYKKPFSKNSSKNSKNSSKNNSKGILKEYKQRQETKHMLLAELKKRPKNKICKTALESCNKEIQDIIVQHKKTNFKRFHDLLNEEREQVNENKFFIEKMSYKEQIEAIEKMEKYQKKAVVKKPYRFDILDSSISENLKTIVLQKINQMENMEQEQEYHKLKNWIDTFMKIPFGKYKNSLVNLEKDGLEETHAFMNRAQTLLDDCTYGLKEAKLQIMQMLGNWITNPTAMGTAIAIKGPPGTGKTSLVKEGVSKILGRDFVFIPLGGSGDGTFLEGHSYTYEGSTWGKIVQSLIECQSMNPVFYFDELDKVSESQRGQEIINILIHLTDQSQNSQFTDKYFTEINEFDLSKCLFIFSYNDETKVNPILLNRMHVIQTKGYNVEEKLIIGKNYLLPKILQQIHISTEEVVITDEIMKYILSHEQLCKKEDGVRNFKRALEIIYSKLNLYRIMKPDAALFKQYPNMPKEITFPHTITRQDLDLLIKNEDYNQSFQSLYI